VSTHVWLVRHAEAVVNVERRVAGPRCDPGLTPLGVAQAEALRRRLEAAREFAPHVLVSSTLPRAQQTARLLAPAVGLDVATDDGLCEMHPGAAEGLTFEECEARYGPYDPRRPISPGGETWQRFVRRVDRALERLTRAHAGRTLLLVAHGWVVEASFVSFFGLPNTRVPRLEFQVTHTSLTHWYERRAPAGPRWYLGRYNDAAHLQPAARFGA
jgi:probable phosphoglycerate mutase